MRLYERAGDTARLIGLVATADAAEQPVLIVGGGSGLVVGDAGFDGLVIRPGAMRTSWLELPGGAVIMEDGAGRSWDALVAECVNANRGGVEALSGIPGTLGAAPVGNISAFGHKLAEVVESVSVYDRATGSVRDLSRTECAFGYRSSLFRRSDRFVILSVRLRLQRGHLSAPLRDRRLADALGAKLGAKVPLVDVRQAVLGLRREAGMLLDVRDPDSRSAGDFFLDPVVDLQVAERLAGEAPLRPAGTGQQRIDAKWLVERAGFAPGYEGAASQVALSTKNVLAISNRGGATAAQVMALAGAIMDEVRRRFGLELGLAPRLVAVGKDPG